MRFTGDLVKTDRKWTTDGHAIMLCEYCTTPKHAISAVNTDWEKCLTLNPELLEQYSNKLKTGGTRTDGIVTLLFDDGQKAYVAKRYKGMLKKPYRIYANDPFSVIHIVHNRNVIGGLMGLNPAYVPEELPVEVK